MVLGLGSYYILLICCIQSKGKEEDAAGSSGRKTLEDLNWDHSFVRDLPGDSRTDGPVRQVIQCNS